MARRVVEAVGGSKNPRRLDRVYATPPSTAGTAGTAARLWGTKPFSLDGGWEGVSGVAFGFG